MRVICAAGAYAGEKNGRILLSGVGSGVRVGTPSHTFPLSSLHINIVSYTSNTGRGGRGSKAGATGERVGVAVQRPGDAHELTAPPSEEEGRDSADEKRLQHGAAETPP